MSGSDVSGVLDNPVWHALTTHQAALAVGAGGARRYREDVSVFWGADVLDDGGWAALAELGGPGAGVVLARDRLPDPPPGWKVLGGGAGHQMIATALPDPLAGAAVTGEIRPLTHDDVGEMLALTVAHPARAVPRGHDRARRLRRRVRRRAARGDGRRTHAPPRTHGDQRRVHASRPPRPRLAGALTRRVADTIVDRGETPILHVRDGNDDVIRVYERLGFTVRKTIEFFWYRALGVLGTQNRK